MRDADAEKGRRQNAVQDKPDGQGSRQGSSASSSSWLSSPISFLHGCGNHPHMAIAYTAGECGAARHATNH